MDEAESSNKFEETPPAGIPNFWDNAVFKMMKERNLKSYKTYCRTIEEVFVKFKVTQDSPPTLEQLEVN